MDAGGFYIQPRADNVDAPFAVTSGSSVDADPFVSFITERPFIVHLVVINSSAISK